VDISGVGCGVEVGPGAVIISAAGKTAGLICSYAEDPVYLTEKVPPDISITTADGITSVISVNERKTKI